MRALKLRSVRRVRQQSLHVTDVHRERQSTHSISGRMCQGGMPNAAGCISAAAARVPSFRKHGDVSMSAAGRQSSGRTKQVAVELWVMASKAHWWQMVAACINTPWLLTQFCDQPHDTQLAKQQIMQWSLPALSRQLHSMSTLCRCIHTISRMAHAYLSRPPS